MGTERNPRTQPGKPRAGSAPIERQRIPLPPLPHFRGGPAAVAPATGAPAKNPGGAVSPEESDLLLAEEAPPLTSPARPGPGHEGRPNPVLDAPSQGRTGESGAVVLNDLVDEIERGLEKELVRHAPEGSLPPYRRSLGCSLEPAGATGDAAAGTAADRPTERR